MTQTPLIKRINQQLKSFFEVCAQATLTLAFVGVLLLGLIFIFRNY